MSAIMDALICLCGESFFSPPNNRITVIRTALYDHNDHQQLLHFSFPDRSIYQKFARALTTSGHEECSCGQLFCSQQTCWPSACMLAELSWLRRCTGNWEFWQLDCVACCTNALYGHPHRAIERGDIPQAICLFVDSRLLLLACLSLKADIFQHEANYKASSSVLMRILFEFCIFLI